MLKINNKMDFEQYTNELSCGKIYLSDICQKDRLAYPDLYICAMRFYRYNQSIPNPLEIWKSDIETLPLGQSRNYFQLVWDGYNAEMKGLAYRVADTNVITNEPIEEYERVNINYQSPSPIDVRLQSGGSVLVGYWHGRVMEYKVVNLGGLILGHPGGGKGFHRGKV